MFLLQFTLVLKILLTLTLWSLLPLLRPQMVISSPTFDCEQVIRGLGGANLALLVMYAVAFVETLSGGVPWYAIGAGLVSNGLGASLSARGFRHGGTRRQRRINGFNLVALCLITLGLLGSGVMLVGA